MGKNFVAYGDAETLMTEIAARFKNGGRYNVKDYGILPWYDPNYISATANTEALQDLIDEVPSGSVIYFPVGVYSFDDGLVITDKDLKFCGETSHNVNVTTDNQNRPESQIRLTDDFPANGSFITRTTTKEVCFDGLSFCAHGLYTQEKNTDPLYVLTSDDTVQSGKTYYTYDSSTEKYEEVTNPTGDPSAQGWYEMSFPYPYYKTTVSKVGVNGIDMTQDGVLTIQNCLFEGFSGAAIKVSNHKFIKNCAFYSCAAGIEFTKHDSWVSNCWFNKCQNAILQDATEGYVNLCVSDTWCDQSAGHFIEVANAPANCKTTINLFNVWIDLIDQSAVYAPNCELYNCMITGRFSRCGVTCAGVSQAQRSAHQEWKGLADVIFAKRITNCNINATCSRRKVNHGGHLNDELVPSRLISTSDKIIRTTTITAMDLLELEITDYSNDKLYGLSRVRIHCNDCDALENSSTKYNFAKVLFRQSASPVGTTLAADYEDQLCVVLATGDWYIPDVVGTAGSWKLLSKGGKNGVDEYSTLPTPNPEYLGHSVIYTGATTSTLEEGGVYICKVAEVENPTGNPHTKKYYELISGEYVLSEDTTVDNEKTYYAFSWVCINEPTSGIQETDFVTPEEYGAVGDGVTDDTTAFNNAITAARTARKPLKLTKTYYLASKVSIMSWTWDLTIIGSSVRGTNVVAEMDRGMNIIAPNGFEIMSYVKFQNVGFKNYGVTVLGCRNVFDGCSFNACDKAIDMVGGYGSHSSSWYGEVTIKDCSFCECTVNVDFELDSTSGEFYHDCIVRDNIFTHGKTVGTTYGCLFSGNHFYNTPDCVEIEGGNNLFVGNYFDGNGSVLKVGVASGLVQINDNMFYKDSVTTDSGATVPVCELYRIGNNSNAAVQFNGNFCNFKPAASVTDQLFVKVTGNNDLGVQYDEYNNVCYFDLIDIGNGHRINEPISGITRAELNSDYIQLGITEDLSSYSTSAAANVMDYGAVGDGTTDDSQAFLDAIATGKTKILVPRGKYNLNNVAINLGSKVTFVGENPKFSIILNANIAAPYGITVENIAFDGGTTRHISETGFPASMNDKEMIILVTPRYDNAEVHYKNCEFRNADIASCAFWGAKSGVDTGEPVDAAKPLNKNVIQNCLFENITYSAVFHSVEISYGRYLDNTFKNIGGEEVSDGSVCGLRIGDTTGNTIQDVDDCVVANNKFDTQKSAYVFTNVSHDIACNFVMIHGTKIIIDNNVFKDLLGYGKDREAIYTKGRYVEISNNYIENGSPGGEGYICCKRRHWDNFEDRLIKIHDNVLVGKYGVAISTYGATSIFNNDIKIERPTRAIVAYGSALDVDKMATFEVRNNNIAIGVGPIMVNGTVIPADSSTVNNKPISTVCVDYYKGGVFAEGNNITIANETGTTYGLPAVFDIKRIVSDVHVNGNVIETAMKVSNCIMLSDNATAVVPDGISSVKIEVKNNVMSDQKVPMYLNFATSSTSLKKVAEVFYNFIRGTTDNWALAFNDSDNNNDVLVYRTSQAKNYFTTNHIRSHVKNVYIEDSSMVSNYSGHTSTFYQLDQAPVVPSESADVMYRVYSGMLDVESNEFINEVTGAAIEKVNGGMYHDIITQMNFQYIQEMDAFYPTQGSIIECESTVMENYKQYAFNLWNANVTWHNSGASYGGFIHGYFYELNKNPVENPTGNPKSQGWWVETGSSTGIYELTEDTSVVSGTTYYTFDWEQMDVQPSGSIQVTTLPIASADVLGKVYQYVGATNANYTHNYFYECKEVADSDPTEYEWVRTNAQLEEKYLEVVYSLPTPSSALIGKQYYMAGETPSTIKGHVYECNSTGADWIDITPMDKYKSISQLTMTGAMYQCITGLKVNRTYLVETGYSIYLVKVITNLGTQSQPKYGFEIELLGQNLNDTTNSFYNYPVYLNNYQDNAENPILAVYVSNGTRTLISVTQISGTPDNDFDFGTYYTSTPPVPFAKSMFYSAASMREAIAPLFDSNKSYSVGDIVWKRVNTSMYSSYPIDNIELYRCIVAHSGDWSASHFEKIQLCKDFKPGSKIFPGTLDEWEALTEAEQAEYDFVASPEEAAYPDLPCIDISSQITMANDTDGNPIFNSGSGSQWDIFSCVKYGRMVVFSVCFGTFTGKVTNGFPCFTGLPKAVAPAETGGSFDTRWFINKGETRISLYFSRSSSELENTATRFQLVYFTED